MKGTSLVVACLLACRALAVGAGVNWDVVYTADVPPRNSAPSWSEFEGPNTSAEITPVGLHLVDQGTARRNLLCYSMHWAASPRCRATVEATLRVVSCTARSGMCVLVSNGINEDTLTFYPDRIELSRAKLKYAMDTTDVYHTYRVCIHQNDVTVWADGRLVINGSGRFTSKAYNNRRLVMFGSISSPSTGEAYWKAVKVAVELPPAKVIQGARRVVIYKKKDVYACFPSITRLDDGRFIVRFGTRVRRSHIDSTGGSATYVSDDACETWRPFKGSYVDPTYRMPWGGYLRCGAGGWRHVPASKRTELEAKGLLVRKVREGVIAHGAAPGWVRTSSDGKTWTQRTLPTPHYAFMQGYGAPGFLVTRKGTVLYTVYGNRTAKERQSSFVMRSADRGETWEWITIAPADDNRLGFSETALFENDRGEIGAMLRPSPEATHNTFVSFSKDDGKTWSAPTDAGFWGYPCQIVRLKDGTLLCSYGYRREHMGIRACVSRDGGHTWDVNNEIVLRADGWGNGGDLGYPKSVQLKDGHIFTVYYINLRDNITHIAGTHWKVPP